MQAVLTSKRRTAIRDDNPSRISIRTRHTARTQTESFISGTSPRT